MANRSSLHEFPEVRDVGEASAREAGKFRLEGKDYVVQDGDVKHFWFSN